MAIAILWRTKIVSHFILQRHNEVFLIRHMAVTSLNECRQEQSRYRTEFEQEVVRLMRYERRRLPVTSSQKIGKDELYEEL